MPLRGAEFHHHAIRMRSGLADQHLHFYRDVLGLIPDAGSPEIPNIPLYWMNCGDDTQIHMFEVEGVSEYARRPDRDPFASHMALGVPDIEEAKRELDDLGVDYWRVGRNEAQQVFIDDPSGNRVELHQIGTCRCTVRGRNGSEQPA